MKGLLSVFVISVFFVTAKGKCPMSVGNSLITTCEGSTEYGQAVYVDFNQINRPCTCIVTPLFDGELLVTSREEIKHLCATRVVVQTSIIFGCPLPSFSTQTLNVEIKQRVNVHTEYIPTYTSGAFYHCMVIKQNGGLNGHLSVKCEPPANQTTPAVSSTISTTTSESATSQLSQGTSSIGSSTSMVNTNRNTDVISSSNMTTASYYPLPMKTTQDASENMIYIIAGSAAGGALILTCLIVIIIVLMNRSRCGGNKNRPEGDMAHTNEVFDNNPELPENPLYISSQPMDKLGYSSDHEKQLGLPPADSKLKKIINSNYDIPPNNKPIDNSKSSMPVYAVPKKSNVCTPDVSTGDVYAQVYKPDTNKTQFPARNCNEDGLLYMEVEQNTASTKRTNTDDKIEITEGGCYAEIKRP